MSQSLGKKGQFRERDCPRVSPNETPARQQLHQQPQSKVCTSFSFLQLAWSFEGTGLLKERRWLLWDFSWAFRGTWSPFYSSLVSSICFPWHRKYSNE